MSLSWELDGPVLLDLLEEQHIPLWSSQRKENEPIVFGGGPVLTANPEPMAPFFDVILLGDGEQLVPTFIESLHKTKGLQRTERLEYLAQIPGIYIPSLYEPQYSPEGNLIGVKPLTTAIPASIHKQTWREKTLNHSAVITPEAAWPNIHMVEVVRSCPEMCRFCLASYLTLPFRTPPLEEGLIPAIEKGLTATKRIGLLGASVTQHPQFTELLRWINKEQFSDIRLSVSSVRASTVTSELSKILSKHGNKSLTMAIESGSQRIRTIINKKLSEEEIFRATKYIHEGGLTGLKLYGMVGLPTEQETDIEATMNLMLKLKQSTPGLRLTLGVSTFVPKAHTPFQWEGVNPDAKKRLKILSKKLKSKGIEVRPESFGWSIIQTLISRSDRRLAPVIAAVRGSQNSLGQWKQIYKASRGEFFWETNNPLMHLPKPPPWEKIIFESWETSTILPWMHLEGPLKHEQLIAHHQQALSGYSETSDIQESCISIQPKVSNRQD